MQLLSITILSVMLLLTSPTYAQDAEADKEAQEAVSKLAFIVGNWNGSGWMMGRDGQKHTFNQTENISFKLDKTALLVEGLGKDKDKIMHNAMAVVTYNKADKNYNFRSYLSNGREGVFKAELIGEKFYWYPMANMRYIIYLNDKGQWHEVGEMKRENDWFKFFEMILDKK